jgi:hypothetical protein
MIYILFLVVDTISSQEEENVRNLGSGWNHKQYSLELIKMKGLETKRKE